MTASILSNGRKHGFRHVDGEAEQIGKATVVQTDGSIEALAHIGQAESAR
jgi:5-oxoprolinase (ATP-hydrolysing)